MKYSIVIPCYNEEKNLVNLVDALDKFPKKYDVEFILVENGSLDGSRKLLKNLKKIDGKRIKTTNVDVNQGYGYGIKQGLKLATGDYVGWIHADLQLDPEELCQFFDYLNKQSTPKYLMKGERHNRKVIEYIFTYGMGFVDSLIFKKHMYDVMSMPVIFSRDLLKYYNEFPNDFSLDIYIYAKANELGYKIVHLPVTIVNRKEGKSSWNTGLKSRIKQSNKMFKASIDVSKKIGDKMESNKVHVIMPMGGAGSRFFKNGFVQPKPLIEINDKPFLYWATNSLVQYVDVADLTFVVLQEHIDKFNIDEVIHQYYPDAKIVKIPHVLNGAVLTSMEGAKSIHDDLPIIFNDCDHMFKCSEFNHFCDNNIDSDIDGALLTFKSTDPKYSFLQMDKDGNVIKTVEKKAISDNAICGAYYFKNKDIFLDNATEYLEKCNYSEYFMSGVYNVMADKKMRIANFTCDSHLSFGTPDEYYAAEKVLKKMR